MSYRIIETHQVYKNGKLDIIAVLWQSNPDRNWVRASFFTPEPLSGYGYLLPSDKLDDKLIQKVAGYGPNLPDDLREKFFPGERDWER